MDVPLDKAITDETPLNIEKADSGWRILAQRGKITFYKLGEWLNSPGYVNRFIDLLQSETNRPASLLALMEAVSKADVRVRVWFDQLPSDERYFVLALSLADRLPKETFWAIYERLTQRGWRERIQTLTMTDYQQIQSRLSEYIVTQQTDGDAGNQETIGFKDEDARQSVIRYAIQNYGRSLVQALPILADIITGTTQKPDSRESWVVARLRDLDISGPELVYEEDNQPRRDNVRLRLIDSIVQIARREPATTEHLLLAWAEGSSASSSSESRERLRAALSDTLIQMYKTESANKNVWMQRDSFALLRRWYRTYRPHSNTVAGMLEARGYLTDQRTERRTSIRMTLVRALCALTQVAPPEEFGEHDAGMKKLTTAMPDAQPNDPVSPWHMLLALAWDPYFQVRQAAAAYIIIFNRDDRYYQEFEDLLRVLASDWNHQVRAQTAWTMRYLALQKPPYFLYLINHLLDQKEALVNRDLKQNPDHYLHLEYERVSEGMERYPLHLWTACLSMLYLAEGNWKAFSAFAHSRLQDGDEKLLDAFSDALDAYVQEYRSASRSASFRALNMQFVLRQILLEATGDNRLTKAANRLEAILQQSEGLSVNKLLTTSQQQAFNELKIEKQYG
jgi:hypothetical protein